MGLLYEAIEAWWHDYYACLPANIRLPWVQFKEAFHAFSVPAGANEVKVDEFCNLTQGRMSVLDYANSIYYLAQYAPLDIPTNDMKCLKFKNGLHHPIQELQRAGEFDN